MADIKTRGLKDIYRAFKWSIQGLKETFKHESSFRLEVYLFIILIPIAIWLSQEPLQLWMLMGSAFFVLIVEILNSAIEAVVDLVCGEKRHPLAARAKDMGSAAVFMSQLLFGFTWLIVIYNNFF
ncbi:MAG: diacylglycerol kinase [Proteobacteria bacterium]|nr:diacylglycerol kinase [Pseudomonadota bacterium]